VDYIIFRLYREGRRLVQDVSRAGKTRGRIVVDEIKEGPQKRTQLVARVIPAAGHQEIPLLYGATLAGKPFESWFYNGWERIEDQLIKGPREVVQCWQVEPAADEDLQAAQAGWVAAQLEMEKLKAEIVRLGGSSEAALAVPFDNGRAGASAAQRRRR
jgi:hypothetical protein